METFLVQLNKKGFLKISVHSDVSSLLPWCPPLSHLSQLDFLSVNPSLIEHGALSIVNSSAPPHVIQNFIKLATVPESFRLAIQRCSLEM